MEAIDTVGGVNSITANIHQRNFVSLSKDGQIYIYWFDAQKPASVIAANQFFLQNNVIIYVPPSGVSAWNRSCQSIIPSLSGGGSINSIVE